jgi:hypothetical protein
LEFSLEQLVSSFFVLFLLYARFPVIAQAEVKTILKATDNFIRERAANKDKHHE